MNLILIVDDDPLFGKMLTSLIKHLGHEVLRASNLREGRELAQNNDIDVLFLDVRLPDGNGLQALPGFKAGRGRPEVIIVTGEGDQDGAELAIANGAWDYLEKPSTLEKMTLPLLRALEYRAQKGPVAITGFPRHGIVGSGPAITTCLDLAAEAAEGDAGVLLCGETGTGKELVARAIHDGGGRANKPFVVVDCGALPDTLLEAALFGHVKGAFTGADQNREGMVGLAHEGTLFLDEVGELPLAQQRAFLRLLQEKRYRPLGDKQEYVSDFRVMSATNKDLDQLVRQGAFRQDLLYRLRTVVIELPPLRERGEDMEELARHQVERLCANYGLPAKNLAGDLVEALHSHDWPGNIRELFAVLERAVIAGRRDPTLFASHLPINVRMSGVRKRLRSSDDGATHPPSEETPPRPWKDVREQAMEDLELRYLKNLLAYTAGNVSEASRVSGLSRQRLHTLLRKHGLGRSYRLDRPDDLCNL